MPSDYFGLGGHVIDGQFHAIEVAGEGGFSVVYRGQHLSLREPIAIKCLKIQVKHKDPAIVASFTQRFFDESRIMYRLSQGNLDIARSVTSGVTVAPTTGATVPYMVLEWLDGVSLAKDLKDRRAQKLKGRPLPEVIALFEPAALAVGYAHSQGVVHRDIKPGNLFLHTRREGLRMKVLDFGMAKVLSPEAMGGLESAATLGGVMVVSPQYVTPEQLEQGSSSHIGPWTDVYAFALILCEALTDRRARDAATFADLMLQITEPGPLPTPRKLGAIVSESVDRVFERALARKPAERYPDMNAFWSDLTGAAAEPLKASGEVTRIHVPDFEQTIGMPTSLPSEVREYLAQGKANFNQTVPLAPPPEMKEAAAKAVQQASRAAFSGTLPLQSSLQVSAPDPKALPMRRSQSGGYALAAALPVPAPTPAAGSPPNQAAPAAGQQLVVSTAPMQPQAKSAPAKQTPVPLPSTGPMKQVAPMQAPAAPIQPPAPMQAPAPALMQAPAPMQPPAPMQAQPASTPPAPAAGRTSRVLVFFLLLFVLVALGVTGMLLYRILVLHE